MESRFDGTVMELFGVNLAAYLLTFCTLGIAYPWALVMKHNCIADHTLIDGNRVRFDGTGAQLFGIWIKISLLTLVTFGIYYFWAELEVQRWVAQHTHLGAAYAVAPGMQQPPVGTPVPLPQGYAPAPLPQTYAPAPVAAAVASAVPAPVHEPVIEAAHVEITPATEEPGWTVAPEPVAPVAVPDLCASCGARLPENARFCQKCGSPTA